MTYFQQIMRFNSPILYNDFQAFYKYRGWLQLFKGQLENEMNYTQY